jgi:hypothetical protein
LEAIKQQEISYSLSQQHSGQLHIQPAASITTTMQPPARLHSSGSLDQFNPVLVTPVIGNEFIKESCNIVDDILHAPNADQRIRDLAIMSMATFHQYAQMY